jgi:hypothetical protein
MPSAPTYLVVAGSDDSRTAYIEDIDGNVPDSENMDQGVSLKKAISKSNTFSLSRDGGDMLGDFVDNISGVLIISARARTMLEAEGVEGKEVEYLPFTLKDKRGRPTKGEYFVANLLRKVACMDRDKSEFTQDPVSKSGVLGVSNLTVVATKVPKDVKLFRLGEFPRVIVIRSDLVKRIKAEKLTGLRFLDQGEDFTW